MTAYYPGVKLNVFPLSSIKTANAHVSSVRSSLVQPSSYRASVVITLGEFDQYPIVPIYYTSSSVCVDGTVTLSTNEFLTYQWQYSTNGVSYVGIAGANSSSFTVSSTVNGTGYYRVKVTVPYTGGDFYSGPVIISFYNLPTPTVSGTMAACGSTVLSTQNYFSYQWIKDGIDINGATAQTYVATESGNYAVRVGEQHGTSICTGTSPSTLVTIYGFPAVTISGDSTGCVAVDLSTQTYSSYQWMLNNVPIPGATAQNYTATATGDYTVSVVDSNGCSATSAIHSVQLFGYPTPPTINVAGAMLSVPAIYSTYQWLLEGVAINGATSSSYLAAFPGNYSVEITDAHGCSATSDSVYVVIMGAYITVTPNLIGPPTLEVIWPGQQITDVYWFINDIASIRTTETLLVPTVAGNYKAALSTGQLTTVTPSVNVDLSYEPLSFELNVLSPVGQGGCDRYAEIVFEVTEQLGRSIPVSYINFSVHQNGNLLSDLIKGSPYVSYEEIPNGWRFIINGPSNSKYRFKSGAIIEIKVVIG